jgi:hypothetical protein
MNLHTKLTSTIALYIAAVALIVPLAAVAANSHPADAASITTTHPVSTAAAAPTDCTQQTACPDDATDYWAKDAYAAYAAPIKDMPEDSIKQGFLDTYVGTYSTQPNWGPAYVSIPSPTAANVFHVFLVSNGTK